MKEPAARTARRSSPRKAPRQAAEINPGAELLRVAQTAAFLGVGLTKVWSLRREDPKFPKPVRLGGDGARAIAFRRSDLLAWIEGRQA